MRKHVDNYVSYDKSWKFTVEDFTDRINMLYVKTVLSCLRHQYLNSNPHISTLVVTYH